MRSLFILAIAGATMYLPQPVAASDSSTPPIDIAVPKDHALSDAQVRQLANAAVHGDSVAAMRLTEYFADINDMIESNFWLQLAAEQGECTATREFLKRVRHMKSLNNPDRIDIWSKREIENCAK